MGAQNGMAVRLTSGFVAPVSAAGFAAVERSYRCLGVSLDFGLGLDLRLGSQLLDGRSRTAGKLAIAGLLEQVIMAREGTQRLVGAFLLEAGHLIQSLGRHWMKGS